MRRRDNITRPSAGSATVVDAVTQQAAQAAALAGIEGQDRLLDPSTNPAVRPHADRLRDAEQVKALDAQHTRSLRQHRVADKRAANAEKTLEVLRAARHMASPARSMMVLHKGRTRFMGVALTASIALSIGSATGPGDLAYKYANKHSFIGWIAEVGLTGLSTMAIMYRSHLGEHGTDTQLKDAHGKMTFQAKVLLALAIVPLMAGVVANAISHGAIGVLCSLGAAAFGFFAHVISGQSSTALQAKALKVTNEDEAKLHAMAMGEDLHAPARQVEQPVEEKPAAEPREAEASDLFSDAALARWLNSPPEDEEGRSTGTPPGDDDTDGVAKPLPSPGGDAPPQGARPIPPRGRIGDEQDKRGSGGDVPPRGVGSAVQARRARGAATRTRVAEHIDAHPDDTLAQIAAALDLHRDTVKKIRRDIRRAKNEEG